MLVVHRGAPAEIHRQHGNQLSVEMIGDAGECFRLRARCQKDRTLHGFLLEQPVSGHKVPQAQE